MSRANDFIGRKAHREKGAVLVLVALALVGLLGAAALSLDIFQLVVVRNELQNAADAGALAGAMRLYTSDGTAIRTECNQEAYDTAVQNISQGAAVEIAWSGGNSGDVERGHWSFATRTFTPNDSLLPTDLWNRSTAELDADLDFINAVRVRVRRQDQPVGSIFAHVFGISSKEMGAEATAYIGYSGKLLPGEVDQPIAICEQSILQGGAYTCNTGRMINSGANPGTSNTAGWTSLVSEPVGGACSGTNSNDLKPLICGGGNPDPLVLGDTLMTTGGANQVVFDDLRSCWIGATSKTQPWKLTLPVVDCVGNNIGNCPVLKGAVTINLVWMTKAGTAQLDDTPTSMVGSTPDAPFPDWNYPASCSSYVANIGQPLSPTDPWYDFTGFKTYQDGMARWDCFVDHFNLKNADGTRAPLAKKSMYFLPDCTPHDLTGTTGGENFGVLAKYPALVD